MRNRLGALRSAGVFIDEVLHPEFQGEETPQHLLGSRDSGCGGVPEPFYRIGRQEAAPFDVLARQYP